MDVFLPVVQNFTTVWVWELEVVGLGSREGHHFMCKWHWIHMTDIVFKFSNVYPHVSESQAKIIQVRLSSANYKRKIYVNYVN